jgi:hypothetical protein
MLEHRRLTKKISMLRKILAKNAFKSENAIYYSYIPNPTIKDLDSVVRLISVDTAPSGTLHFFASVNIRIGNESHFYLDPERVLYEFVCDFDKVEKSPVQFSLFPSQVGKVKPTIDVLQKSLSI